MKPLFKIFKNLIKKVQANEDNTKKLNEKNSKYEIIANKIGTFQNIDLNKYNFIYLTIVYAGVLTKDTVLLGGNLVPTCVLKSGVQIDNAYITSSYNGNAGTVHRATAKYDEDTKTLTIQASDLNNMKPVLIGIY